MPPLQLPPMGPNFGALLVGTFISLMYVGRPSMSLYRTMLKCTAISSLFGVELHQMYRYTRLFGSDPSYLKYYVSSHRTNSRGVLKRSTSHFILGRGSLVSFGFGLHGVRDELTFRQRPRHIPYDHLHTLKVNIVRYIKLCIVVR